MSICSLSVCSMMKHSGALISSRLMPPKVGPMRRTALMNSWVFGIELDVDGVHVGEPLEEHGLALHHRFGAERAEIAKTQNRRAVGDHRHQIALVGVVIGEVRVGGDFLAGHGNAGGIG